MEKVSSSAKKYTKYFILGPMFKFLEVVFELITPFLTKEILDQGVSLANENGDYSKIIFPGLLIILFCILGFASTMVCQYMASIASQGFGTDLRNRVFNKILHMDLETIDELSKGNLITNVTNDTNKVQQVVAMLIRLVIRSPFMVFGSLVCAFIINPKIAIIYLVLIPLFLIIYFVIFLVASKKILNVQNVTDQIVTKSNESINGIRVIKAFNKTNDEINEYKTITNNYYKESKASIFINELTNPITILLIDVAICLVIYIFANERIVTVNNIELTSGDLVALISYLNQMLLALIAICNLVIVFTRGFASSKRLSLILNKENRIKESGNTIIKDYKIGDSLIRFQNVSFRYLQDGDKDKYNLNNINFEINKGECVGIIGGTGAGKTTLVKLIDRLYDVNEGSISYKNVSIKDYDLNNLRKEISIVDQKAILFAGTIESNIRLGKLDATREEILKASKDACADEFISELNDGYNSFVEENGRNFSGGQRQRISIARSLIKDSELLILDDSTSALDYLTEKNVRKNIKNKEISTIIISQRVSSLQNCDRIYVMHLGEIVDVGKHEDLLSRCKIYQEIYQSQIRSN